MSDTIQGGPAMPVSESNNPVEGRKALRVYGYAVQPGDIPALGGPAQPVYVVTAADLAAGKFDDAGNVAIPVYTAPSTQAVLGGPAIPVYPVNAWP